MSDKIDDGGPAFPTERNTQPGFYKHHGMSLRAYAAIKLRVPESGVDWLDAMIRQAKRDEFAGQALASIAAPILKAAHVEGDQPAAAVMGTAKISYLLADAMLIAREASS